VRLTTSLLVGAKYFGCVVCRFRIAAGAELCPDRRRKQIVWSVAKSASINLQKLFLSPTGLIKPWFHTKGNLLLCSSYLPLGVPNWVASTANQCLRPVHVPRLRRHDVVYLGFVPEVTPIVFLQRGEDMVLLDIGWIVILTLVSHWSRLRLRGLPGLQPADLEAAQVTGGCVARAP
jgi:hypothetical protein